MSKEVGVSKSPRKNLCQECGEPFEWPEFSSFMLSLRTATIDCIRCQTENHKVVKKNVSYFFVLLVSIFIGFLFFILINIPYMISSYDPYDGTTRMSGWFIGLGFFGGLYVGRIIMNIYYWNSGVLSTELKHKKY